MARSEDAAAHRAARTGRTAARPRRPRTQVAAANLDRRRAGYDKTHRQFRAHWAPTVAAGTVTCARAATHQCAYPDPRIHPGQAWDLGHTDDRTRWTGPEHARCNRAAAGRRRHQTQAARHRAALPTW